jgi:hypothetical protein
MYQYSAVLSCAHQQGHASHRINMLRTPATAAAAAAAAAACSALVEPLVIMLILVANGEHAAVFDVSGFGV